MSNQILFRPADAARELGINEDSVTRHAKKRPSLFPPKTGRCHEWTPDQYERVKAVLVSLSYKTRRTTQAIAQTA